MYKIVDIEKEPENINEIIGYYNNEIIDYNTLSFLPYLSTEETDWALLGEFYSLKYQNVKSQLSTALGSQILSLLSLQKDDLKQKVKKKFLQEGYTVHRIDPYLDSSIDSSKNGLQEEKDIITSDAKGFIITLSNVEKGYFFNRLYYDLGSDVANDEQKMDVEDDEQKMDVELGDQKKCVDAYVNLEQQIIEEKTNFEHLRINLLLQEEYKKLVPKANPYIDYKYEEIPFKYIVSCLKKDYEENQKNSMEWSSQLYNLNRRQQGWASNKIQPSVYAVTIKDEEMQHVKEGVSIQAIWLIVLEYKNQKKYEVKKNNNNKRNQIRYAEENKILSCIIIEYKTENSAEAVHKVVKFSSV
jgi:hypothetical protein